MRAACTSPGSRCAPLVLTLAREERLRCYSHVDERCAGFFALGAGQGVGAARGRDLHLRDRRRRAAAGGDRGVPGARAAAAADRRPSAGAARERRRAGDRSAEAVRRARRSGSSRSARTTRAPSGCAGCGRSPAAPTGRALEGRPGVVHLNFPLREPLVTDEPLPDDETGRPGGRPYVRRSRHRCIADAAAAATGGSDGAIWQSWWRRPGAAWWSPGATSAHDTHWVRPPPRSARPRAGRCWRIRCPARVAGQRRSPTTTRCCATRRSPPRTVPTWSMRVGRPAGLKAAAHMAGGPGGRAPGGARPRGRVAGPGVGAERLARTGARAAPSPSWHQLASSPAARLDGLAGGLARRRRAGGGGDPRRARRARRSASRRSPPSWACCWERRRPCSSPPRCRCATSRHSGRCARTRRACCATAAPTASTGPCRARSARPPRRDGPVVLLIGDVALAHDIGGLLAAKRLGLKLTIVLLDNGGGGIFDFLPVSRAAMAQENDIYTRHIATPTGLDFATGRRAVRLGPRARRRRSPRFAPPWSARSRHGRLDDRARADRPRRQRGAARPRVERGLPSARDLRTSSRRGRKPDLPSRTQAPTAPHRRAHEMSSAAAYRWGRMIARRRRVVLGVWVLVLIACAALLPGTEALAGSTRLRGRRGGVVVSGTAARTAIRRARRRAGRARVLLAHAPRRRTGIPCSSSPARSARPAARATSRASPVRTAPAPAGRSPPTGTPRSRWWASAATPASWWNAPAPCRHAVDPLAHAGVRAWLTGYSPVAKDITTVENEDVERAETIGVPIALAAPAAGARGGWSRRWCRWRSRAAACC